MKRHKSLLFLFLLLIRFVTSCQTATDEEIRTEELELTEVQSEAFDALNSLQTNTQGHLYSTFVDSQNAFEEADTSFVLSQTDLKSALSRITIQYGIDLPAQEFEQLVETSVLAQEEYKVEYFGLFECAEKIGIGFNGLPTTGKWIVRGILNRRDLILLW